MDVKRLISILWEYLREYLSLLIIFIKITFIKYYEYLFLFIIKLKKFMFKKRSLFVFIKIFFSLITIYHCIVISVDYLGFEYRYNLIVEDNSEGFDWKPMSVCTESKVLFDKHKVNQYFNLCERYSNYENRINNIKYKKWINEFNPRIENQKMYVLAQFFVRFVDRIFVDLNFVELSSLIVNANELFECSAKLHFNNESIDSNAMEIENCFEYFRINTTVKADNTFGICYDIFENNSSIVMKKENYIKIIINFKEQQNFIISGVYSDLKFNDLYYNREFYQYFRWFYFINDEQSIESKSSLITSTRIGLTAELKISKTSIEMLSVPYMTFCEHQGCRHDFYKIILDTDGFDYNHDTILKIENSRKKHLIYNAEPSLEFVDFISNIGGLLGLYFGLSFIDISDILKSISIKIIIHLQKIILFRKMKQLIELLQLSQHRILKYIKRMTKIPWKFILTFVSSPFFISQMFDLIINYFHFPTQISFEFVEYQQNNQKISINEFPAITVCTEHMFEKAFFDQYFTFFNVPKLFNPRNSPDMTTCWSSYNYKYHTYLTTSNKNIYSFIVNHCKLNFDNENIFGFLSKYFDINTVEEYHQVIRRIEDKHRYGLNGTLDLLDFYVNHHNCSTLNERISNVRICSQPSKCCPHSANVTLISWEIIIIIIITYMSIRLFFILEML